MKKLQKIKNIVRTNIDRLLLWDWFNSTVIIWLAHYTWAANYMADGSQNITFIWDPVQFSALEHENVMAMFSFKLVKLHRFSIWSHEEKRSVFHEPCASSSFHPHNKAPHCRPSTKTKSRHRSFLRRFTNDPCSFRSTNCKLDVRIITTAARHGN